MEAVLQDSSFAYQHLSLPSHWLLVEVAGHPDQEEEGRIQFQAVAEIADLRTDQAEEEQILDQVASEEDYCHQGEEGIGPVLGTDQQGCSRDSYSFNCLKELKTKVISNEGKHRLEYCKTLC